MSSRLLFWAGSKELSWLFWSCKQLPPIVCSQHSPPLPCKSYVLNDALILSVRWRVLCLLACRIACVSFASDTCCLKILGASGIKIRVPLISFFPRYPLSPAGILIYSDNTEERKLCRICSNLFCRLVCRAGVIGSACPTSCWIMMLYYGFLIIKICKFFDAMTAKYTLKPIGKYCCPVKLKRA